MDINFSGIYKKIGEEQNSFSFSQQVDDEVGRDYLTDREPGNGYPHYDDVKNFVVAYLIEKGVLPSGFSSGVYGFANALAKVGVESLNFEVSAQGCDSIFFPCLNNG